MAAILNPEAPMGMSVSSIPQFPFQSFLVPGIILFGLIGLGNIAATAPLFLKRRWAGDSSGAMGSALMIWIVVQCVMLGTVVGLHVIFFVIGAVQGCLALAMTMIEGVWPGTWAMVVLNRMRKTAG